MNDIEEIWNRILEHCSNNLVPLERIIFKTKNQKEFYIIMDNIENINPCLLENNNLEWNISKTRILNDLNEGHPTENELVKSYSLTAQSYRYGLLHDKRIYLTI